MGGYGSIDPASGAKYEPAWGNGFLKSGELPPATPDTSMMFKDGPHGRTRNHLLPPPQYNNACTSPMFIPFLNEASPRPPPTRTQHYQSSNGALNLTLNLNVNSGAH